MLIINADDFGSNTAATDNILACYKNGRITSASAMVFMADSERAAELALATGLDVGLHLNLTHTFNGQGIADKLTENQTDIADFLLKNKYCQLLYNPILRKQFDRVYHAQYDEFVRLYGRLPTHIDGHHHMHLCMNMLIDRYIPKGYKVRKNFSFFQGEKNTANRLYRYTVDRILARRYVCSDYFFSISPISDHERLKRIVSLAESSNVELMVHPEKRDELAYLMSEEYLGMIS
jgi:chitin disaccharide deacetylase